MMWKDRGWFDGTGNGLEGQRMVLKDRGQFEKPAGREDNADNPPAQAELKARLSLARGL